MLSNINSEGGPLRAAWDATPRKFNDVEEYNAEKGTSLTAEEYAELLKKRNQLTIFIKS